MRQAAASLGVPLPEAPELAATAAAGGIAILALLVGWGVGRWIGPRLADFLEAKAGARTEGLVPRVCAVLRYLAAWLVAALALGAYRWPAWGAILLGLVAAGGAALAARQVVRGLNMPRWAALLLAGFLFVAIFADAAGGLAPITQSLDGVAFRLGSRRLSLLGAIQIAVALLALYMVVRLVIRLAGHVIERSSGFDPTQQLLAQKLMAIIIIGLAFFVGIDLAGIDLTALAVFSGALGLAVGFGLQKTFGNLIAGIILLMDRSIKPGDVISVGESFGSVNKIGVRAVSIVTREGKEHLIPNEILMTEEVINWSYSTRDVRISIKVGVAYGADVELAQKLMIEAATAARRVLASPKPVVWMTGFGDSAIDHEIRVWIRDPEAGLGSVRSDILNRLWKLFKENGVEIPFPQRDVHVKGWPAPAGVSEAGPPAP